MKNREKKKYENVWTFSFAENIQKAVVRPDICPEPSDQCSQTKGAAPLCPWRHHWLLRFKPHVMWLNKQYKR